MAIKIFFTSCIAFMCITQQSSAANDTTVRLVQLPVKPSYEATFRKALTAYVVHARKAHGNIMVEAHREEKDSTILWLIERWSSSAALELHAKSNAAKAIAALVKDGLASPADTFFVHDLEPLPAKAWRQQPAANDRPLTIMLFVDAKEGTGDHFKSIYHTAMPAFRGEPGVITYQLSEVTTNKHLFVTYEKFRSEAAFQYHLTFPPIEPVIHFLRTSIKEQPFEKGLHRLIELTP